MTVRNISASALLSLCLAAMVGSGAGLAEAKGCLRGINISGAEFGKRGGVIDIDYTWPSTDTMRHFAERGFDSLRIPFKWERLQPVLNAPLDATELDRLEFTVAQARALGLEVVLDPHNYARYDDVLVGTEAVPAEAFADFWARLAARFANQPDVHFGLMNEPYDMDTRQWLAAANAAAAAIRGTAKANNLILVPGNSWSGAHSWFGDLEGGSNASVMSGFKDPADNFAFEVHQYLDSDFSGTSRSCERAGDAVKALEDYTSWLRINGYRGYLGEFGGSSEPACLAGLKEMTAVIEANRDVWIGWAYWVAGDWWPESEALNIQPTEAGDRPQLESLRAALAGGPERRLSCR